MSSYFILLFKKKKNLYFSIAKEPKIDEKNLHFATSLKSVFLTTLVKSVVDEGDNNLCTLTRKIDEKT